MTVRDTASCQSPSAKDPVEGSRETVEKELKRREQDGPQGRHPENSSRAAETARQERAQGAQPNLGESGDPTLQSGDETGSLEPDTGAKKAKMAPHPSAPSGLEQDSHGKAIPFEFRTEEDQDRAASSDQKHH
jgi:hypothetical protein